MLDLAPFLQENSRLSIFVVMFVVYVCSICMNYFEKNLR